MSDPLGEPQKEDARPAEVFLSYHSPDRPELLKIRELLATRGIASFLDRDNLVAGMPWPQALEQALGRANAVAVFLGGKGFGLWQKREMGYALDRQVREEAANLGFPVIPVLLPGSDPAAGFLFLNTWIDLRRDVTDPEAIDALARAIRGTVSPAAQGAALAVCPYRGLRPFLEEDRSFFFGRKSSIERVLEATLRHPLVAVVGPSGSGKSSLVHAGLFPKLRARRPPDPTWDMVSFVPTDRPFHQLAAALIVLLLPEAGEVDRIAEGKKLGDQLARGEVALEAVISRALEKSGGTDRLLLVVDQFEELFNRAADTDRETLVSMLLAVLGRAPVTVLITLRASFYPHIIESNRALSDYLERGVVNLGPPTREELREAIVEPARRVALELESGLVERILDDLEDTPGQFSLLEFALTRLWDKRRDRVLTHVAYDEIHTVAGAVAQRAEEVYQGLSSERQTQARHLFTRLWAPSGANSGKDGRQRATVPELGQTYWPVIKALADARLVVTASDAATGVDTVEVAHDGLIRDWDRLKGWLAEDRDFLLWRSRMRESIADWETAGAGDAALLRGRLLEEARAWNERRAADLTRREIDFIRESELLVGRELAGKIKGRNRWLAGTIAFAVIVAVLMLVSVREWQRAEGQRQQLNSQHLASQAMEQLPVDPETGLLLAIQAIEAKPTLEAQDALRHTLEQSRVRRVLVGHSNLITALDVSADGKLLATGSTDRDVRVWDMTTGKPMWTMTGSAAVLDVLIGRDGKRVFAIGRDGVARAWDVESGKAIFETRGPAGAVTNALWSPDGSVVLAIAPDRQARLWRAESGRAIGLPLVENGGVSAIAMSEDASMAATGGADGGAALWNAADGALIGRIGHIGDSGSRVSALAFNPDGRSLAVGAIDGSIRLWNTRGREVPIPQAGHRAAVTRVLFSPDGAVLASAGQDNAAVLWDVRDAKSLRAPRMLSRHADTVDHLAFSTDGRMLATASRDQTAIIWDVATGGSISELRGHTDSLSGVQFSPDRSSVEMRVITVSRDRSARVWAAVTGQDWTVLRGHAGEVTTVAFSPDGTRVLTAGSDNLARIWSVATRQTEHVLSGHRDSLEVARFSPDGTRAVTGSRGLTARVWNIATGETDFVLEGHTDALRDARFSPDGGHIVTAGNDGTARIWDARNGKPRLPVLAGHADRVYTAVFSPDSRQVATGSADRTAKIWDLVSGRVLSLTGHKDGVRSVAFSADGKLLATASDDGTSRVWQVDSGALAVELKGHEEHVRTVEFSPDGRSLVTASWDGTARIWDSATGAPRHTLKRHRSNLSAAGFSPDGKLVASAGWDASAYIWNAQTGEIVRELSGHNERVLGIAFSPDGKLVATASRDGTARLWASDFTVAGDAFPCGSCGAIDKVLGLARTRVTRGLTAHEQKQFLGE